MNDWPDLLTTALLGTGRRPLPNSLPASWAGKESGSGDPAVRVLDLAARHRVAVRTTATPAPTGSVAGAEAPAADRSAPGAAATELIAELVLRPTPELINCWLARADLAGCGVPASQWTRVARLAAHSSAYDRRLLGRVLGARGRWFLAQNPDWRRLAADCEPVEQDWSADAAPAPQGAETIRSQPAAIFAQPDPWPDDVVAAAFAVIGSAALGRKARDYAGRVGARLPSRVYPSLGPAAEYYLTTPGASPAQRRMIKECFVIMEQAAFARVRIDRAFAPAEQSADFRRVEIAGV